MNTPPPEHLDESPSEKSITDCHWCWLHALRRRELDDILDQVAELHRLLRRMQCREHEYVVYVAH